MAQGVHGGAVTGPDYERRLRLALVALFVLLSLLMIAGAAYGQRQDSVQVTTFVQCPASVALLDSLHALDVKQQTRQDSLYALLLRPPPRSPCDSLFAAQALAQPQAGGFWRTVDTWAPRVTAVAAVVAVVAILTHHHKVYDKIVVVRDTSDPYRKDDDDQ